MKPDLSFGVLEMPVGRLDPEASVPDLAGGLILQNELEFYLDEEDEIYEGYGRLANSYPYRQYSCYSRALEMRKVRTAVLENDFLKAVFLPEWGGRLWRLTDKEQGRNLLYTNKVLRCSNLAVRNAWFSGGVEWNIGVIGHSPFTAAPLFTSVLEDKDGVPVLRMYEYERIRRAPYQMDFWLGERDRFLNARMRIVNDSRDVVPMYWWSNIAVPEYLDGRIIVPAEKAYTFRDGGVYKVDIPVVDGIDITKYKAIPSSTDYFFEIPERCPKYIAHVDGEGYGLLHLSTGRLKSRKLFSWGSRRAADRWQEFLTQGDGRYVEIQAGLGKTQYGCLPMAPHTAWEWLERYGAVQIEKRDVQSPFGSLRDQMTQNVLKQKAYREMEDILANTKYLAKQEAEIKQYGSGFAALENAARAIEGKPALAPHLDFGEVGKPQKNWAVFLETGILKEPAPDCPPDAFVSDEIFFRALQTTINKNNHWYAHYHLGLFYFQQKDYQNALTEFHSSAGLRDNPWSCHGQACAYLALGEKDKASDAIRCGLLMRRDDMAYVKEGFRLLAFCEDFSGTLELYGLMGKGVQEDGRISFYYIQALVEQGKTREAYDRLIGDGWPVPDDVREGEISLKELWERLQREGYGREEELPYAFDFSAF